MSSKVTSGCEGRRFRRAYVRVSGSCLCFPRSVHRFHGRMWMLSGRGAGVNHAVVFALPPSADGSTTGTGSESTNKGPAAFSHPFSFLLYHLYLYVLAFPFLQCLQFWPQMSCPEPETRVAATETCGFSHLSFKALWWGVGVRRKPFPCAVSFSERGNRHREG